MLELRVFTSSLYHSLPIAAIGLLGAISMVCFVKGLLVMSSGKRSRTS